MIDLNILVETIADINKKNRKRLRNNWAILAIVMFLIGIVIGHLLSGCMFRTNLYEDDYMMYPRINNVEMNKGGKK
jgi:uncharacterized membrane protein